MANSKILTAEQGACSAPAYRREYVGGDTRN